MESAVKESEAFDEAVKRHIDESEDLMNARDTLFSLLVVTAGAGLAETASERMLVGDLLGRLEVARRDEGMALAETTWASLTPKEAVAYFKRKKVMTTKEAQSFRTLEDRYQAKGFSVAGMEERYVLDRTHGLISEALERGTTKREFLKNLDAEFEGWGVPTSQQPAKHHLETVFDTNVLGAYAAGRYEQMTHPDVLKARPYWQYKTAGDSRVRPTHQAMNNKVFPADSPVWDEWYPPNGYRCRCEVVSLSPSDVEREKLPVEADLPKQVEVGGHVHQMLPDPGFGGSPRIQARADAGVKQAQDRTEGLGMLRAPEPAGPGEGKVFRTTGDLLRTEDAARRTRSDAFADVSPAKAEGLYEEQGGFFNIFPAGQLGKPGKGETWVEIPVYSQNLDGVEQVVRRVANRPRMGHLADRMQVAGRATYGPWSIGRWPDAEVVYDDEAAKRIGLAEGKTFMRSTEAVLRFVTRTEGELKTVMQIAMQTQRDSPFPVRRAWEIADVRMRGAGARAGEGFVVAVLNRRKMGSGEQVVLSQKPMAGWRSEKVAVNEALYDILPEGGQTKRSKI